MPIFRLDPIDPLHPDWRTSTHHLIAIVRARTPRLARWACTVAFAKAVEPVTGQLPPSPWGQENRVTCRPLDGDRWSADGPTEILHPALHHADIRRQVAGLAEE